MLSFENEPHITQMSGFCESLQLSAISVSFGEGIWLQVSGYRKNEYLMPVT
jgi:hypothetical protein